MTSGCGGIGEWLQQARGKLQAGALTDADLDELDAWRRRRHAGLRQRLLYLHAATPYIGSQVLAADEHDPFGELNRDLQAEPEFRYGTVHEAIRDGWQVVKFPDPRAPFDDRELDVLGYEFILQKMVAADDDR